MGTIKIPKPVQFFSSIIFREDKTLAVAQEKLQSLIGNIQGRTSYMSFHHTDYYEREMGKDLLRMFVIFEPLLSRELLSGIKIQTNDIENELSRNGNRTINIDPGYISLENVILATTKGYNHRIYIGEGIYADLTLIYSYGSYNSLGWTYPDYAGAETISMFNMWRKQYKEKLS